MQGLNAYRNGNLTRAIAAFDQAIQLDPKFAAAYVDRGITYYRQRRFERAFAELAKARRIEHAKRQAVSQVLAVKKPRTEVSETVSLFPLAPRRAARLD